MIYLIFIAILIWLSRVLFVLWGAVREKKHSISTVEIEELPYVSIIIPSRNEENNIAKCLDAIIKTNYPTDKMEIICVNDCSDDDTEKIIKQYTEKYSQVKLCNVIDIDRPENLIGKPGALQAGFDMAVGKYILMTDADCIVAQNWVMSNVKIFLGHNADLIAGLTTIDYNHTLFSKIQALEWFYMGISGSSGLGWERPLGCFGNNLSITSEMKDKVGAYKDLPFSLTEDQLLMLEVNKLKGKIRYNTAPELSVATHPIPTMKEYLSQHARWSQGIKDMGGMGVFLIFSSASLIFAEIASLIYLPFHYFLIVIGIRLLSDFIVMFPSLKEYKKYKLIKYSFVASLFFMSMEFIAPLFLLKKQHNWKGRKLESK